MVNKRSNRTTIIGIVFIMIGFLSMVYSLILVDECLQHHPAYFWQQRHYLEHVFPLTMVSVMALVCLSIGLYLLVRKTNI